MRDDHQANRDTLLAAVVTLAGALLVLLAGLLSGCSTTRRMPHPGPVLAQCAAECYERCTGADGDTGIRWDGSPTDPAAFDALAGEVVPALAEKLRVCEARRRACTQCLDRLEHQGVIRQ